MLQFYFLSIAANLTAGLALSSDWFVSKFAGLASVLSGLSGRRARVAVGLAALLTGFGTLFVPVGSPLVLGDLFPSLVGMAMGIALLFEVLKQDALFPAERAMKADKDGMRGSQSTRHAPPGAPGAPGGQGAEGAPGERAPLSYRTALGILGLVAAVLHFFLPERPFL